MLPGGIGANGEDVEPAIKVVIQSLFLAYNEAETKHTKWYRRPRRGDIRSDLFSRLYFSALVVLFKPFIISRHKKQGGGSDIDGDAVFFSYQFNFRQSVTISHFSFLIFLFPSAFCRSQISTVKKPRTTFLARQLKFRPVLIQLNPIHNQETVLALRFISFIALLL